MSIPCSPVTHRWAQAAPSTTVRSAERLSDRWPHLRQVVPAEISMESLILAQDERWRRA